MPDASDELVVKRVQDEVKDGWFKHALKHEEYDAVLVLAHMHHEDELVEQIRKAIRGIINKPQFPIQFITGHSHIRAISFPDDYSSSFEAGKFLDTVGFVSFPTYDTILNAGNIRRHLLDGDEAIAPEGTIAPTTISNDTLSQVILPPPPTIEAPVPEQTTQPPYPTEQQPYDPMPPVPQMPHVTVPEGGNPLFKYVFMDANVGVFGDVLGGIPQNEFDTDDGIALSEFIYETQEKMGLHEEIGCADRDYILNTTLDDESSLWRLFQLHVGPYWFQEDQENHVLMVSKDTWRYDLKATAPLILDDLFAVAPFNDTTVHLGEYDGSIIKGLEETLNLWDGLDDATSLYDSIPSFITVGNVTDDNAKYHLYTFDWSVHAIHKGLAKVIPPDSGIIIPDPTKTSFSSTLMWVKYALEVWPCNGNGSNGPQMHLPDWFPTQDTVTGNDDDKVRRAVAVVLAVIIMLFVIVAITCFFMFFRYLCCSGHSALSQEELDAFTMDNDYDDDEEYDEEEMNGDDVYDMGGKDDYDTEMTNGDQDDNELL